MEVYKGHSTPKATIPKAVRFKPTPPKPKVAPDDYSSSSDDDDDYWGEKSEKGKRPKQRDVTAKGKPATGRQQTKNQSKTRSGRRHRHHHRHKPVDMSRIEALAEPHASHVGVKAEELELETTVKKVGDRKKHSSGSIKQEISRLEAYAKRREDKIKALREKAAKRRRQEEEAHCTFKPKTNHNTMWHRGLEKHDPHGDLLVKHGKAKKKKKKGVVTVGRRVSYQKFDPRETKRRRAAALVKQCKEGTQEHKTALAALKRAELAMGIDYERMAREAAEREEALSGARDDDDDDDGWYPNDSYADNELYQPMDMKGDQLLKEMKVDRTLRRLERDRRAKQRNIVVRAGGRQSAFSRRGEPARAPGKADGPSSPPLPIPTWDDEVRVDSSGRVILNPGKGEAEPSHHGQREQPQLSSPGGRPTPRGRAKRTGPPGETTFSGLQVRKMDADEKFDAIMDAAQNRAVMASHTRLTAQQELLRGVDPDDLRVRTMLDRAGNIVHSVADAKTDSRVTRYETLLAQQLTDPRPPHRKVPPVLPGAAKAEGAAVLARHPMYRRRTNTEGKPERNQKGAASPKVRLAGTQPLGTTSTDSPNKRRRQLRGQRQLTARERRDRGDQAAARKREEVRAAAVQGSLHAMPNLARTGSFFMSHVENSNRRLERLVQDGWGRVELLQQLEFELMRAEFDSAFSQIETQMESVRREERDRKNREIVKQARAKQQRMKTAHAVKMNLLAKQKDVPKATLERARYNLRLLHAGRIDYDPEEEALADVQKTRAKRNRRKKVKLRGANAMRGGEY